MRSLSYNLVCVVSATLVLFHVDFANLVALADNVEAVCEVIAVDLVALNCEVLGGGVHIVRFDSLYNHGG